MLKADRSVAAGVVVLSPAPLWNFNFEVDQEMCSCEDFKDRGAPDHTSGPDKTPKLQVDIKHRRVLVLHECLKNKVVTQTEPAP